MATLEGKVVIQLSLTLNPCPFVSRKTDSHVTGKYVVTEVGTHSERADSRSYLLCVVGLSIT
jgi:hypothetical protein